MRRSSNTFNSRRSPPLFVLQCGCCRDRARGKKKKFEKLIKKKWTPDHPAVRRSRSARSSRAATAGESWTDSGDAERRGKRTGGRVGGGGGRQATHGARGGGGEGGELPVGGRVTVADVRRICPASRSADD